MERTLIWAMEPSFVRGKNVVNLITFKDSNGKLHKRLAPEEIPPRLHNSQVNSYPLGYKGMRDFSRPAVNLDDILGTQQRKHHIENSKRNLSPWYPFKIKVVISERGPNICKLCAK
ncbi:CBK_G0011190.mRNA.1.CDS.1 [Saccharomyces cerevisiae]|nr:CBK_G0011190.mRNA.1.CDS.1 [Saccharomyces cerevisiae]CAI7213125.1 CBK_G0011190.mRNA.1.CDS.1 [Saccharomyces cerevisiae]